jgi:hypothetical protein
MQDVEINKATKITLYSSVKELPITLSKKFQHFMLQDIGIGNTIESIDDHLERVFMFMHADKKEEAMEEAKNLRYNLFSMLAEWDFKALSFACLIKCVNGEPVEDRSPEGLNALLDRLSTEGLTVGMVDELLSDVKKNWIPKGNSISLSSLETTPIT